jgi:dihydroorotate dehydrogenase (NAD+) catalytic subunit
MLQCRSMTRLATRIGDFALSNPVICGAGEPVMTEAGIRAALRAGAAGVIAKSVNENPAAARQLDRADYVRLDADGAPTVGQGLSLFNRSGLMQRDSAEWFAAIAAIDRDARADGRFVGASIVYATPSGAVSIAAMARVAGLRVFELNVGAPHASEAAPGAITQETDPDRLADLVRQVRLASQGMQLWVKLTGLSANLPALAIAARRGGADAVCMMGRFMGLVPDLDICPGAGDPGRVWWRMGAADRLPVSRADPPGDGWDVADDRHQRRAFRRRCHAHGVVRGRRHRIAVDRDARGVRRADPGDRRVGFVSW